jgi:hypothetical protein
VSCPNLPPPTFECTDMEENSLSLHYRSDREGLTPMILGLVQGLGNRFDTEVDITQTQNRDEGAEHDEFLVIYKPN